jgi:hypothetical protein
MTSRRYEIEPSWIPGWSVVRYSFLRRHFLRSFGTKEEAEEFVRHQEQFDQEDYERSRL